jgi:hypothetical protein
LLFIVQLYSFGIYVSATDLGVGCRSPIYAPNPLLERADMKDVPLRLTTISKTWANSWKGLFAIRPVTYLFVILLASFTAYAYKFRKETIFACQAAMYSSDRYIASCNGTHYADYEHGAFAFDLEPKAENFARDADVVFLGNSRL